jgi:hypothetical protein
MHYEKTNGIAVNGHGELKGRWATHQPQHEILLAWLLGFVSHLVTDATIHPIVQATVGEYSSHKEQHRTCEMTQDSLIFNEVKNNDVTYAEFSEVLKFCAESPEFPTLMAFWKRQLQAGFPDYCEACYRKVMLPGNGTGAFKKESFDRAAQNVIAACTFLFDGLTNDTAVDDLIRN